MPVNFDAIEFYDIRIPVTVLVVPPHATLTPALLARLKSKPRILAIFDGDPVAKATPKPEDFDAEVTRWVFSNASGFLILTATDPHRIRVGAQQWFKDLSLVQTEQGPRIGVVIETSPSTAARWMHLVGAFAPEQAQRSILADETTAIAA